MKKKTDANACSMKAADFDAVMRAAFKAPEKYPKKGKGVRRKKKGKRG